MPKLRRRLAKYWPIAKIISFWGIVLLLVFLVIKNIFPLLKIAKDLTPNITNSATLKNDDGRINVAILGVGGTNHDGPDLTDTIIIASIPATKSGQIFLLSLPRDIYLDSLSDKINGAYTAGEEKKAGGGFILSKAVLTQVTGIPIHYGVKIDFAGFSKIIDLLGGVDIEVANSFTDNQYPLVGKENDDCGGNDLEFKCRYETISFTKGPTHMDGAMALKFARSRHSLDLIEGTDFARAARQQKLILAIKQKFLSLPVFLSVQKIGEIYQTLKDNIFTDASPGEINSAIKLGLKLKDSQLKSIVLPEDLFYNPPVDYRGWILLPASPDFSNVKEYIKEKLTTP